MKTKLMICPHSHKCDKKDRRKPHQNEVHDRCVSHKKHTACVEDAPLFCAESYRCPPCIPYPKTLQVGDRVRVLGKSTSCLNDACTNRWVQLNGTNKSIGDIVEIKRLDTCAKCKSTIYHLGGNGDLWCPQDLEYIEKEEDMPKTKYKILKSLTLVELIEKSELIINEVINVLKWMGTGSNHLSPRQTLTKITGFTEYAKEHPCFWKFVIEKGYIEEIKESAYDKWVNDVHKIYGIAEGDSVISMAKCMPKEDAGD